LDFESFTSDKKYFIMRAYAQSKLANVMFTYALARRLEGSAVTAVVLHPGVVGTPIGVKSSKRLHRVAWKLFTKFRKMITPKEAAITYVYLATSPEAKKYQGVYFHAGVLQRSSEASYDQEVQEKLWAWSEQVAGVKN
jgi:NAD(P)-dependent dehydrogenase (short-subunit alcohol dehydrogenase family)